MGETGVGKSVVMQKYLDDASGTDEFVAYTMKYSAQTKPINLKVVAALGVEPRSGQHLKHHLILLGSIRASPCTTSRLVRFPSCPAYAGFSWASKSHSTPLHLGFRLDIPHKHRNARVHNSPIDLGLALVCHMIYLTESYPLKLGVVGGTQVLRVDLGAYLELLRRTCSRPSWKRNGRPCLVHLPGRGCSSSSTTSTCLPSRCTGPSHRTSF